MISYISLSIGVIETFENLNASNHPSVFGFDWTRSLYNFDFLESSAPLTLFPKTMTALAQ